MVVVILPKFSSEFADVVINIVIVTWLKKNWGKKTFKSGLKCTQVQGNMIIYSTNN